MPLSIRQSPSIGSFKRYHLFTLPGESIFPTSDTSTSDSSMLEFVRYTNFVIIIIIITIIEKCAYRTQNFDTTLTFYKFLLLAPILPKF